jgi:ribosomal-protein-alanine N-acetyltransferase
MHLERIFTTVETNNIGSWKVLEKNGFLREGKLRHSMMLKDGLHDCYMYAILAEDYFKEQKS